MIHRNKRIDVNPFNSIGSILTLVLVLVGLYFVAKGLFTILSWLAPVLLIVALVLNHKVVLNYGKWLIELVQKNIIMGIAAILLTVVGFPVIAGFLAVKAYLYRKVDGAIKQAEEERAGEFIEYEEIDDDFDEPPLELPDFEKRSSRPSSNQYDQLFDDDRP